MYGKLVKKGKVSFLLNKWNNTLISLETFAIKLDAGLKFVVIISTTLWTKI